jgi:aryl-alcohol dehydrogenase-like predicted oxidoreductase
VHLREAENSGRKRFVSVQNEYSILHREPEHGVLDECERLGLAFVPYFPLANGLLSGKYRPGEPAPAGTRIAGMPQERAARVLSEENLSKVAALTSLAESEGHSLLELAMAFLLAHRPVASVIAGATRPEQVRANVAAGTSELDPDVLARVDEIAPA